MENNKEYLQWWESLSYDSKYRWFAQYCNRFTRDLEDINEYEIKEIWEENIKKRKFNLKYKT